MADFAVNIPALLARLAERDQTLATAESLTAGLLAATIVDIPGASKSFRGGLIVYATDLKHTLAGVDQALLDKEGPVSPGVALALARGARERCRADWGIGTTGVAGPTPQDGISIGTVFVAIAGPSSSEAIEGFSLTGDRPEIRGAAVSAALALLAAHL